MGKISPGKPIKPYGSPSGTKKAQPPKTKGGPKSKPGGKADNVNK